MTANMMTFPSTGGPEGMASLAMFLDAAPLVGNWHFGRRGHFDQTMVAVIFDNPADLAPTLQRYVGSRSS